MSDSSVPLAGIDLALEGKKALVTGAGAGAGRAIALWLAQAGCAIAVVDIDEVAAVETAELIRAEERAAAVVIANVRVEAQVMRMVDTARRDLGGLDVAVNNVGMMAGRHALAFVDIDGEYFLDLIEQNLLSAALCCRAEARAMIEQGTGGAIINVSSGESLRPSPELAPYGAAKAAVNHLTRTLAVELGPHRIRVNAMAPGTMLTQTVRDALTQDYLDALGASIPLGRMTEPSDLGRTAVFLASDLARNVTGQILVVDGGAELSRNRPSRTR